jgi:hypothetical protein
MTELNQGVEPEIMQLFHGTRNTDPSQIYQSTEGFDMKFSRNGCLWGIANYFAVHSSYSHSYAHTTAEGPLQMFLARVITGKTIKLESDPNLRFPPLLPGEEIRRYDSV